MCVCTNRVVGSKRRLMKPNMLLKQNRNAIDLGSVTSNGKRTSCSAVVSIGEGVEIVVVKHGVMFIFIIKSRTEDRECGRGDCFVC